MSLVPPLALTWPLAENSAHCSAMAGQVPNGALVPVSADVGASDGRGFRLIFRTCRSDQRMSPRYIRKQIPRDIKGSAYDSCLPRHPQKSASVTPVSAPMTGAVKRMRL